MKTFLKIALLWFLLLPAFSEYVVFFDEATGEIKDFRSSYPITYLKGRTDVLIDPKGFALFKTVPKKHLKAFKGAVVERTAQEKSDKDAAELQAQKDAERTQINDLDITIKDAFVAWLQVYNSKVPAQYRVSQLELVTKIKENKGL